MSKQHTRHTGNSTQGTCIEHGLWPYNEDKWMDKYTRSLHATCGRCCWCESDSTYFSKLPADITHNLLRKFICRGGGPKPPQFVADDWMNMDAWICWRCFERYEDMWVDGWHKLKWAWHWSQLLQMGRRDWRHWETVCTDTTTCERRQRLVKRRERAFCGEATSKRFRKN